MPPFDVTEWGHYAEPVVHVLLGMGFGFVLERAGFGSAKKLTGQFYLNDMTVLKVMFTAIITAMVLIQLGTTFGLLDYDRLWINPTYLGSGIVGGLLFGVGFVVGGYCPGTALVALATLKVDGLLFVLGVLGGILAFGYTEPQIEAFWNDSGDYGTLTLFDWLGLPMPVAVVMAVGMALAFFAGGEWVERWVNREAPRKGFRPAYGFAASLLGTAVVLALVWPPTAGLRDRSRLAQIEETLRQGKVQIEASELADLMRDKRLGLALIDLRDEPEFNRFHLLDARRAAPLDLRPVRELPARTVKVLLGSDEAAATVAYRRLALDRVENLYILKGGLSTWPRLFGGAACSDASLPALGALHPCSRPPPQALAASAQYVAKVKRPGLGKKKAGGGCGG